MKIFETHAHYDDEKFNDSREEVLKKVVDVGIERIVNVACDYDSCISSYNLAKEYDYIYYTIGVHPYEAENFEISKLEEIYDSLDKTKLVAVGEIGLDYSHDDVNLEVKETQKKAFIQQIAFAKKHSLPIIIHTRDASLDTYSILNDYTDEKDKILLHCFSPTDDLVKFALSREKCLVAFGGNITYKRKESFFTYLNMIPMEKIVIETDSPYLPPEPKRGTINDSSNLVIIAKKLAEFKGITAEEVAKITYENASWFYNI